MASRLTKFLKLFIPDLYDKGTVVTDVFDPNFTKLDQNAEAVDASLKKLGNDKLDKDLVSEDFNTAKKIEDKIKGINEKFKNFCPYGVRDIYITTKAENPSTVWLGTTWEKIEGRFLLGTSSSQASKLTGGSMNKNISQANLPNVKLSVNSFSLSRGTMNITGKSTYSGGNAVISTLTGAFKGLKEVDWGAGGQSAPRGPFFADYDFEASRSWTGTTNSASPQTNSLGSGQALDITPSFYTTHMWLRTS